MNILTRRRTKLSISLASHLIFPSPKPPLQFHHNYYSTHQQNPTNPRPKKNPYQTFSQRIKKESYAFTWPKPQNVPYNSKDANFINLIGYIKMPVLLDVDHDGKHSATTVINVGDEMKCILIPVVFEGDLAYVVACHVRENDVVFVSGRLSVEGVKLVLSEGSNGEFHVVGESFNFVVEDTEMDEGLDDVYVTMGYVSRSPGVGTYGNDEPRLEAKCCELRSGESVGKERGVDRRMYDLWKDLLKNPVMWWDYRDLKCKGFVKERHPDFKHKASDQSLWSDTAPTWVLAGIEKLELDVKKVKAGFDVKNALRESGKVVRIGKHGEDSWKDLVENPDKWYDNRVTKRNPKAPDFKHKVTGEALWIGQLSAWALSRLPPIKDGQNAV